MKYALKHIGVFLLWNLVVGSFLLFSEPLTALPIALGLSGVLLWGYLLRPPKGRRPERRWATLRLRPLRGAALGWSIAAVPVLLVLSWALGDVYTQLIPVPADSLNPFGPILRSREGRFVLALFAVAVAPIVEEFFFRGILQRHFERRLGIMAGIATSAGLFAVVHLLPWVFPLHFFLGMAFGYAVWAARSIWTGVMLHAANNAAAMLGLAFSGPEPASTGTLWEIGFTADLGTSLTALVVSAVAAIAVAAKLRSAGHDARLRTH
jgi:membrane protease YdiL (CAAX protease family)